MASLLPSSFLFFLLMSVAFHTQMIEGIKWDNLGQILNPGLLENVILVKNKK